MSNLFPAFSCFLCFDLLTLLASLIRLQGLHEDSFSGKSVCPASTLQSQTQHVGWFDRNDNWPIFASRKNSFSGSLAMDGALHFRHGGLLTSNSVQLSDTSWAGIHRNKLSEYLNGFIFRMIFLITYPKTETTSAHVWISTVDRGTILLLQVVGIFNEFVFAHGSTTLLQKCQEQKTRLTEYVAEEGIRTLHKDLLQQINLPHHGPLLSQPRFLLGRRTACRAARRNDCHRTDCLYPAARSPDPISGSEIRTHGYRHRACRVDLLLYPAISDSDGSRGIQQANPALALVLS